MMRLEVREEAELDILEASVHYERERRGLGLRFEGELNQTMCRVQENPRQFPEIEDGVRRALVRTFPYGIFFCLEKDIITVLAVLHLHRHSQTWKSRL
jgi:plasmid stabilization system protein ParE